MEITESRQKHPAKVPENQRHHFIPRFILKTFISRRRKIYCPGSRQIRRVEKLAYCYDISGPTVKITKRPISEIYCIENLYKDIENPENPHEIEKKLSVLETKASSVISKLIAAVTETRETWVEGESNGSLSFEMTRRDHNCIRKFMYIMYYRKHEFAKSYWREDDPENDLLRQWLSKFCERENIKRDPTVIWLCILRYYLDTQHPDIIDHGRKAKGEYDRRQQEFPNIRYAEIDPNLENWQATGYSNEADGLFLAIWKAAPEEEFILSENSFGLFEGGESPFGPIHRFYVISPKIVLVLCSVGLGCDRVNPALKKHCQQSMLWEASHKPPKVTYAKEPPKFRDQREQYEYEVQENHWEDDVMEFEISTLSKKHTHIINDIILGNANDDGLITFCSRKALFQTLDSFGSNPNFINQSKYAPLAKELWELNGRSNSFEILRFDSNENFISKYNLLSTSQANPEEQLRFLCEFFRRGLPGFSGQSIALAMSFSRPLRVGYGSDSESPSNSSSPSSAHPSDQPPQYSRPPLPSPPRITPPALPAAPNHEAVEVYISGDLELADEPKSTAPWRALTLFIWLFYPFFLTVLGYRVTRDFFSRRTSIKFAMPFTHSLSNNATTVEE